MHLAVFSHKLCWRSEASPSGYATDGGFPAQMRALSELFDSTTLVVPCAASGGRAGESPIVGSNLSVARLSALSRSGIRRKAAFPLWLARNAGILRRELRRADAVHAAVPGDVGTVGMALALAGRKPLLVRYCNNWLVTRTVAERLVKGTMERFARGRNVMLATGGGADPPSRRNSGVTWIFATGLTERDLQACARPRIRLPGASPRLILVGRLEKGKGTGILIESLPRILEDFPEATLEILGDGSARGELEALAMQTGVGGRVGFRGNVAPGTVLRCLQEADLFCFPTKSEGFPKVVVEALACGLPVVTTRVSVLPVLLSRGAGLLLNELTPASVAEGVRRCLSQPDTYRAMSASALETAKDYSLEKWRDRIGDRLSAAWGPLRAPAEPLRRKARS